MRHRVMAEGQSYILQLVVVCVGMHQWYVVVIRSIWLFQDDEQNVSWLHLFYIRMNVGQSVRFFSMDPDFVMVHAHQHHHYFNDF